MTVHAALAILVLAIGLPINLYVTARLWRLSRIAPDVGLLRERAVVSTCVLLTIALFGVIFVNNDLGFPIASFEDTKYLSRPAMLVLALGPALYWLWLYRRAR